MRITVNEESIENDSEIKRRKGYGKEEWEEEPEEKAEEIVDEKGRILGRNVLDFLWNLIGNSGNIKGVTPQIITNVKKK